MTERLIKDEREAIETIRSNMPTSGYYMLRESLEMAIQALEEVQQYRELGTVEEIKSMLNNGKWILVEDRLPENNTVYPVIQESFVYPVTVDLGGITDIRYYSFYSGHWYNQGTKIMDDLVIAWMERPEPYRPEKGVDL